MLNERREHVEQDFFPMDVDSLDLLDDFRTVAVPSLPSPIALRDATLGIVSPIGHNIHMRLVLKGLPDGVPVELPSNPNLSQVSNLLLANLLKLLLCSTLLGGLNEMSLTH